MKRRSDPNTTSYSTSQAVCVLTTIMGLLLLLCLYRLSCGCGREKMVADLNQANASVAEVEDECQRSIPDNFMPKFTGPIKPNTIFVSIPSYRDGDCKDTVSDLFDKAANPDNIYVGIVHQNKEEAESCLHKCGECKKRLESDHIRVINFPHTDAKGPTFARFEATKLWKNEAYFFQIDSHTKFQQDWDKTILSQLKLTGDPKAVLGAYPPTDEQMKEILDSKFKKTITMCHGTINKHGVPEIKGRIVSNTADMKPRPVMYSGANNLVIPAQALVDVPFDPYLSFLFFGEEIHYSARLWTAGYNIYSPSKHYIVHKYGKRGVRFWDDAPSKFKKCEVKAIARMRAQWDQLAKGDIPQGFGANLERYAMGKERSLREYWEKAGIDFNKKTFDTCT